MARKAPVTAQVAASCDIVIDPRTGQRCGQPAIYKVAAMGGGFMGICGGHVHLIRHMQSNGSRGA